MAKKRILITGAASGIGRETALFFAEKGWFVGAFDIDEAGVRRLETEIGPGNCFSGVIDVTEPDSVKKGMDAFASETGGKLDILLNNAGILQFGQFETVDLKRHHQIVDINLKGCLNCAYYAIKYLKQTPDARIINMSSASSIYGIPDLAVYSATKHALSAMTQALSLELEKYGIHVCDIKPPYVNTPLLETEAEVFSLKKMGINMDTAKVAKTVWKAANGKKMHWKIGATAPLAFAFWLLPFLRRPVVKMLAVPK